MQTAFGQQRPCWDPLPPAAAGRITLIQYVAEAAGCSGFCTLAAPAWAPPYAQVPRPEHMRRGTRHAAPSSCEGYPIRCFLLTDLVVYAPLPISRHALWPGYGDSGGRRRGLLRPQNSPQVIHRGGRFCTAASPRFDLLDPRKWAKNGGKLASVQDGTRGKIDVVYKDRANRGGNVGKLSTASAHGVVAGRRAYRSSYDE